MAYTKTNWVNGQAPALSAENLNKIEEGIYNNAGDIASILADVSALKTEDTILIDKFTTPSHTYGPVGSSSPPEVWWVYSGDMHAPSHVGYTPVGIIGQSPNAQSRLVPCIVLNPALYGDRLAGYVRNSSSSQLTDTVTVTILYVKNEHLNII